MGGEQDAVELGGMIPFFIVSDADRSRDFYTRRLGFSLLYEQDDFALVGRGGAQVMLKFVDADVPPLPNPARHPWAKWDAYVPTSDPDALWSELAAAGLPDTARAQDTSDGQRGCTVTDPDGYVLFFGHPVAS